MNMFTRSLSAVAVALALGGTAVAQDAPATSPAPSAGGPLEQSLAKFLQWAPGEYDNNEQVWQEDLDKVATPHQHIHHIFIDAHASAIAPHTLFVQQNDPDKLGKVYKVRLMSVSADAATHAIRLDMYAFRNQAQYTGAYAKPALLAAITPADVVRQDGCSVYLTDKGDHFEGGVKPGACRIRSGKDGSEIIVNDSMRLSAADLWLDDEGTSASGKLIFGQPGGVPNKNRRVRYFSGWTAVKKAGPTAPAADEAMWMMAPFVIHNEGQIVPIKDSKTGEDSGYSLQLAQLTYQNTRNPILKIGLVDNKSGKTVAYGWASTNADQVGMNLRWFQVGVTQRSGDAGRFGFINAK